MSAGWPRALGKRCVTRPVDTRTAGGDGNKFTESEGYRSEKQNAKLPPLPAPPLLSTVWLIDFHLTVMELRDALGDVVVSEMKFDSIFASRCPSLTPEYLVSLYYSVYS